jgi:multiple sugar transport system permease protein
VSASPARRVSRPVRKAHGVGAVAAHAGLRLVIHLWLLAVAVLVLFPILWMVSTSFKTDVEIVRFPPTLLPEAPTTAAYVKIWQLKSFGRFFWNSTVVSAISTTCSVLLAALAGYGFSRFSFRGSRLLIFVFLVTQMVPAILLLLPYFMLMRQLGLLNSYTGLVLAYTSFALPFCTWMLKGFFDAIPREVDEAAMIDGCSRGQALVRVVGPLALPGVAATALFSFLVAWNHYLFALGLATSPDMYTLPVGIASTIGEFRIAWNELMAGATIASVPILVLYAALERQFVEGLTAGAVKG